MKKRQENKKKSKNVFKQNEKKKSELRLASTRGPAVVPAPDSESESVYGLRRGGFLLGLVFEASLFWGPTKVS